MKMDAELVAMIKKMTPQQRSRFIAAAQVFATLAQAAAVDQQGNLYMQMHNEAMGCLWAAGFTLNVED